MRSRTTWQLLVLAAAMFAAIWFFERPHRAQRDQLPDLRVFPGLDPAEVTAVHLRPKDLPEIRLEKLNGAWAIAKPVDYPADEEKVTQMLQALSALNWQARITSEEIRDRPDAPVEFGFDAPALSIMVQSGAAQRHLLVGARTVPGDQVFLQIVGGDGYFLVDAALLHVLPAHANGWRTPFAVSSITLANGIEVRTPSGAMRLELNPTNRLWRMTRPLDSRAANAKIRQMIEELGKVRVAGFLGEESALDIEQFGLPETPTQNPELELLFFEGTNLLSGLHVGFPATNYPGYSYARGVQHSAVFLAPGEAFDPWRAPAVDFRDRRLIQSPTNLLDTIEIQGADAFSLVRATNGTWRVQAGDSFDADPEMVGELFAILSNMEVNFEKDVVTDFSAYGLQPPQFQLLLKGTLTNGVTGQLEPFVEPLDIGTGTTNGRVLMRRGKGLGVTSISRQEFDLLLLASWQMRDRQVWHFAVSNVVSVTILQKEQSRKLLRNGEEAWSLAPGSQGIINPFLLEEALHRLGELRAIFWVANDEKDRTKYGFEETGHRIQIELERNGNRKVLELELGGFSPFYHPYAAVQLNGQRMVFEFPWPLYFEFVREGLTLIPPPLPVR